MLKRTVSLRAHSFFEYPQHMFWLLIFNKALISRGLDEILFVFLAKPLKGNFAVDKKIRRWMIQYNLCKRATQK